MNSYFVGIGVARAGTSWLGEYFKIHPEICFSPLKEIHYFDTIYTTNTNKILERRINTFKEISKKISVRPDSALLFELKQHLFLIEMSSNPKAYCDYFSWIKKNNEKICGEITPAYSLLPKYGFLEMKKLLNPKIILLLRNPVDRQWSQVKFHKKFFPDLKFNEYYIDSFNNNNFINRSNYQILLNKLLSVFSKDEIHIIFYETLFNTNYKEKVMKNLCDFLDVSFFQTSINNKINFSDNDQLSPELRLYGIKKLKESYKYIFKNFDSLPASWLADLKLANLS